MESTYDIFCTIGLSAFMGLGLWLALEFFPFQSNRVTTMETTLEEKGSSKAGLLFNPSQNAVLHGEDEVLRIKQGSTNHRFISYLFEHEGQDIPIEQLYQDLRLPEDTYLKKLIANTKLPKEIRSQAFVVSKNTIRFQTNLD
ncbi:hypothetical protein KIT90_20525 [Vibrio sp. B172a]|uniref:hypothetical protein n=1 Tax=Vibrio sp. B172a TaxID=2835790 RepID=UPI002552D00C|nr:hypothetical protein [Vibrio sp. B172a]MDK9783768.1 hypothetical protein [Vibrio sp. B172a]